MNKYSENLKKFMHIWQFSMIQLNPTITLIIIIIKTYQNTIRNRKKHNFAFP